eukprot:1184316-Prorocentrum_minimum.AAC.1
MATTTGSSESTARALGRVRTIRLNPSYRDPYDRVVTCMGWRFDDSIFAPECSPPPPPEGPSPEGTASAYSASEVAPSHAEPAPFGGEVTRTPSSRDSRTSRSLVTGATSRTLYPLHVLHNSIWGLQSVLRPLGVSNLRLLIKRLEVTSNSYFSTILFCVFTRPNDSPDGKKANSASVPQVKPSMYSEYSKAAGKYPAMKDSWASVNVKNMYFAGTLQHVHDFKKSAGGFIHGEKPTREPIRRSQTDKQARFGSGAARCDSLPLRHFLSRVFLSSKSLRGKSFLLRMARLLIEKANRGLTYPRPTGPDCLLRLATLARFGTCPRRVDGGAKARAAGASRGCPRSRGQGVRFLSHASSLSSSVTTSICDITF